MDKKNHGRTREKAQGMTIQTDYGKDTSNKTGPVGEERIHGANFGGGESDLSHSLSGATAKQRG